jgi:uncharacterized protein (TIGR01777 family)
VRVLITGATGLIGDALCGQLLARGDEVVGLTRNPERARESRPTVEWHAWKAIEEPVASAALSGCDAVVNLHGETIGQLWTPRARRRIRESRVLGTRNLVEGIASAEPRPRVMVSQSAMGYYGDRGDDEVTEDDPPSNRFDSEVCVAWEAEARRASELGLRVAILRTGLVLARAGGLLSQMLVPFRMGLGGRLGSGRQFMPWIHIADEVGLLMWALDNEVDGVFNAAAPKPERNAELTKTLGRLLGRPTFMAVPKPVLRLTGEMGQALLGGARMTPRRALEMGYEFGFPELEPALRDLLG